MRRWLTRAPLLLAPTVGLLVSCSAAPARDAAPAVAGRDELEAELSLSFRKMQQFFSQIRASGSLETTSLKGQRSKYRLCFLRSQGSSKYSLLPLQPPQRETVWCRNPARYVFELERPPEQRRWILRDVFSKTTPLTQARDVFVYRFLDASHSVCGVGFLDIMTDPSFAVSAISRSGPAGHDLVDLRYEYSPAPKDSREMALGPGEVWLSPAWGWAIVKYKATAQVHGSGSKVLAAQLESAVDYDRMVAGVALPKRIVNSQAVAGKSSREEFVFDSIEQAPADGADFTLSSYGLPEVDPDRSSAGRWLLPWWLAAANVVLALALAVLHRVRKRRHTALSHEVR
jgi:hypothetical protein